MSFGSIPIGFRFHPTDQELVGYYLHQKIHQGNADFIEEMDVYGCEPWSLSHETNPWFKKNEWYYYVRRTRGSTKKTDGKRARRTVGREGNGGTWKATDGEKPICDQNNNILGYRRSLTFFIKEEGKKNGIKSDWVMMEYRLASSKFQVWVLCRIKYKPRHNNPAIQGTVPAALVPYGIRSEELGRNNDFQITPVISNVMIGTNGGPDMSNNIFGQNSGKEVPRLQELEHPSSGGSSEGVDSTAAEVEARFANDPDGVSVDEILALDPVFNYRRAVAMSMPFRSIDETLSLVDKSLGDSMKVPYVKSQGNCDDLCLTKPISKEVYVRKPT